MILISDCIDIRGTAPRTNYDVAYTQDDGEGRLDFLGDVFDADYDRYIRPMTAAGSKIQLLS